MALAPELLPRRKLASAGALNAISMNLAGALGPALGGLVIALTGAGREFVVNAVSFLALIVVVYRWKPNVPDTALPAEHVASVVRTGVRYVSNQVSLLLLLVRVSAIAIPATALASLLPLVARNEIGVSAGQYGLIGAAMDVTAVGAATILPRLRALLGVERLVFVGAVVLGLGLVLVGAASNLPMLMAGAALSGAGQITAFSTVFSVIQSLLPGWVRGRGLATAMLVFQGTLMAATLVSLEWRIDAERRNEFIAAMRPIRRLRRRAGAMQGGLFEDVEEPGIFIEQFTVSTWSEHERQHERPPPPTPRSRRARSSSWFPERPFWRRIASPST